MCIEFASTGDYARRRSATKAGEGRGDEKNRKQKKRQVCGCHLGLFARSTTYGLIAFYSIFLEVLLVLNFILLYFEMGVGVGYYRVVGDCFLLYTLFISSAVMDFSL